MIEELLGRTDYYDFPSFEVALYSLLLAFFLSAIIGLVYRLTYTSDRFPRHFFQAIVLSSSVSSMVIMAVGNNLAAGFGIIGAIAIIRFRTLVRDPRNIIFIFASLSIGIATGVYGYAIAIAGTGIFCSVALLLHYSPFGLNDKRYFDLSFTIGKHDDLKNGRELIQDHSVTSKVIRYRKLNSELGFRYTFRMAITKEQNEEELFEVFARQPGFTDIRLSPSDEVEL